MRGKMENTSLMTRRRSSGARGLSHGAVDHSRDSLEVPLSEALQEERGELQRSSHGKGREITSSIGRT